jgi:hypothetical protein
MTAHVSNEEVQAFIADLIQLTEGTCDRCDAHSCAAHEILVFLDFILD